MNSALSLGKLNFALLYAGHPFTHSGQLHSLDWQMEPEVRAPEWKFANSTHYHKQKVK